jgi:hypothetical protein
MPSPALGDRTEKAAQIQYVHFCNSKLHTSERGNGNVARTLHLCNFALPGGNEELFMYTAVYVFGFVDYTFC